MQPVVISVTDDIQESQYKKRKLTNKLVESDKKRPLTLEFNECNDYNNDRYFKVANKLLTIIKI